MDSWEKSSGICRRFGKGLIIAHDGRLLLRIAGRILIVAVQVLMLNHLFISKLFHTGSIWLNFRTFWCVCNMARPTCSISEGSRTYVWPTLPGSSLCEISNSALMPLHAVRVFCTVIRTRFWSTLMTVKIEKQKLHLYYTHNVIFQDITFCYLHMTRHDLQIIDTIDTPEYMKGELSNDGSQ